jgi:hypothetical protein
LVAAGEQVYPLQLGELLPSADKLAGQLADGSGGDAGDASGRSIRAPLPIR